MPLVNIADFVEVDDPVRLTYVLNSTDQVVVFNCRVKYVLKSTVLLEIDRDEMSDAEKMLVPGLDLQVEFLKRGNEHVLRMPSTVRAFKREGNSASALVEIPNDFKEYFKRRHVRIPARFPVKIHFFERDKEKVLEAESINLSGGGMRMVVYNYRFVVRDEVVLHFQPDEKAKDKVFTLKARVVFVRDGKENKNQWVIAVEFLDVPMQTEDQLVGICFQFDVKRNLTR